VPLPTPPLNYPAALPVVAHRDEIVAAIRNHPVVVVVSETGSGKTTQLPKMVVEALGDDPRRIGCTQPRRLAAASVARRVAEELSSPLGGFVGYQVRFEEKMSRDTRIKFMTDGILLAETQGDRNLKQYGALILDEAHERSLNIDFLLGYLKGLLEKRRDLKLVISSATLDAGAFADFFGGGPGLASPGRAFPVEEFHLPPDDDEDLSSHIVRGVEWLNGVDPRGDVLIFLPGEREIREAADALDGRRFQNTEILPLFARLGLAEQQRIFNPGNRRRIILATNVAETSLTIPGIVCVIDSGLARISRWSPGRGVQRLQIEPVSQASARQRKGRCGRVREGVCLRLYEETELAERPEFNDPEIRRSSLAGVILRMKSLGLPAIEDFPFLDPPAPKAISEGYRTLREVGALNEEKDLTEAGRQMARLPVDPRLGRMLLESREEKCLAEILPIVSGLESNDPRERPPEKAREADAAQARWKDADSDFIGLIRMWIDLNRFREGRNWKRNALRKFCKETFLNYRRVTEWANVHDELRDLLARDLKWDVPKLESDTGKIASYPAIHRSLLAGAPRQFGLWDRESKSYRSASGGFFAIFPGSGLFGGKRWEWVMGMELVETSRLWARRVARIDPQWVEQVAVHLCRSRFGEATWDENQGAVYGKQTVICGGLHIVVGRRVHYGRVDPKGARQIFLREGLMPGKLRRKCEFLDQLQGLREEIGAIEQKLRRPGGLWSEEAVEAFFEKVIPPGISTAAAFFKWLESNEDQLRLSTADVVLEDLDDLRLEDFPDSITIEDQEYACYYHAAPGERDDGLTLGIHVDQLPLVPDWLPGWGVSGTLRERTEILIRSLPKDLRRICQPVGEMADGFFFLWRGAPPDAPIAQRLAEYLRERTNYPVEPRDFDFQKLPPELITKLWICDDDGNEIAFGTELHALKLKLAVKIRSRFEAAANESWERKGMNAWDGEALPIQVDVSTGAAFPALVDEGGSIGVRAFACEAEAREAHRGGCVRLLHLAHPDQVNHLKKRFPLGMAAKIELPRLGVGGTAVEDLIALSAEGAMGRLLPRSPNEFHTVAQAARGRWHDAASKIGHSLDEMLLHLPEVRTWIQGHRSSRNHELIVRDLEEQLAWLFRARFAWRSGYARLLDYPLRLRAIRSRLGRIASLPLIKDLEKTERFRRLWEPWMVKWTAKPEDPRLWDLGWQLEEFRISLFAPDIKVIGKVSEKRLEELVSRLGPGRQER
jgi:ATP-dependent helicase HrpA